MMKRHDFPQSKNVHYVTMSVDILWTFPPPFHYDIHSVKTPINLKEQTGTKNFIARIARLAI